MGSPLQPHRLQESNICNHPLPWTDNAPTGCIPAIKWQYLISIPVHLRNRFPPSAVNNFRRPDTGDRVISITPDMINKWRIDKDNMRLSANLLQPLASSFACARSFTSSTINPTEAPTLSCPGPSADRPPRHLIRLSNSAATPSALEPKASPDPDPLLSVSHVPLLTHHHSPHLPETDPPPRLFDPRNYVPSPDPEFIMPPPSSVCPPELSATPSLLPLSPPPRSLVTPAPSQPSPTAPTPSP